MSDKVPFFLSEAVLSLFPAGPDGGAITSAALWMGSLANRLRMRAMHDTVKLTGSGKKFRAAHVIDEEHQIEIDRTWMIRRTEPLDFVPARGQNYVLEIVWSEEQLGRYTRIWYKRTYFGVVVESLNLDSAGTNQFLSQQQLWAQRFDQSGGNLTGSPAIYTPLPPSGGEDITIPFFRENVLIVNEYLVGTYRWDQDLFVGEVYAAGWASQGVATVLGLEVNGVMTGLTVTLPAGTPLQEVSALADLGGFKIAAGSAVRWKLVSGAAPEAAAWAVSLAMNVTTVAVTEADNVLYLNEGVITPGDYLLGDYSWAMATKKLASATVVALAPTGTATVLALEVGGVLTGDQLVIPAGSGEVRATVNLNNRVVTPGKEVRWKCTSGPSDPVNAAWRIQVQMVVS